MRRRSLKMADQGGLPQDAPAQLRSFRRKTLFRRRQRALCRDARRRALRHQHLRRHLGTRCAAEQAAGRRRRTACSSSTPRPAISKSTSSAPRSCASGSPRPASRPSMPTWSAARMNWSSTALRSRSMPRRRLPDAPAAVRGSAGGRRFRRRMPAFRQMADELSVEAEAYRALVLGVRDYIGKSCFKASSSASRAASIRR
jgi:hypothetical protein